MLILVISPNWSTGFPPASLGKSGVQSVGGEAERERVETSVLTTAGSSPSLVHVVTVESAIG